MLANCRGGARPARPPLNPPLVTIAASDRLVQSNFFHNEKEDIGAGKFPQDVIRNSLV